jgi:uncharacterized protein
VKIPELLIVIVLIAVGCRVKDAQNQTDTGVESAQTKTEAVTVADRVIDRANILSETAEDSIFSVIQDLENNVGPQIAVLTIETLNGEDINKFSLRTANEMNLGRKFVRDGLLLTFALNEGLIRIEVGAGLDKILKDEIALKISREEIVPPFRNGKYGEGLYNGVRRIKSMIEQNDNLIGQ